ncbi:MAG TPA: hypothetical protein VHM91_06450 [Verrucomicrobiales bacterium]|nr:hypothetical protein [Verrucomicrobiales bacterium]
MSLESRFVEGYHVPSPLMASCGDNRIILRSVSVPEPQFFDMMKQIEREVWMERGFSPEGKPLFAPPPRVPREW